MFRVSVPPIGTVMVGVNSRTGNTTEPAPFEPRVNEVKVAAARMAGATIAPDASVSSDVCIVNKPVFSFRAAPRVRPDSVTVMAPVPVSLYSINRII